MIACLQKNFFLTGEENYSLCWIVGVMVLAHLRWGMLRVLLGVYYTLMWDRILQHGGRGLLHVLLWCLLRGRLRRRRGKAPRVFQPFEISNLGAMVSIMTEISTKGTREDGFNIIPPLTFVFFAPLGGFPWFGCPQWVDAVGVDSRLDQSCCYSCFVLSSWHYSMDELD
jgi:hypothetical protein